jgi:hypothetical protein
LITSLSPLPGAYPRPAGMYQIDVLKALEDPRQLAADGFRAWGSAVAMTEPIDYEITGESCAILDRLDGGGWRRHAYRVDGKTCTANPIIGVLAPLAAWARSRSQDDTLGWVEPYLRRLGCLDYPVVTSDRQCVPKAGRGSAEIWRLSRESTENNCEAAIRFAFLCHPHAVPVDVRIAVSCLWSIWALVDQRLTGELCLAEAQKFLRIMLDHLYPHLDRPGAMEHVWETGLTGVLLNMVMRSVPAGSDVPGMSLPNRLAMRCRDIGSLDQVHHNGFYAGLPDTSSFDDWAIATAMGHDMWQISHDEGKPDDNLNTCSMVLEHGISVRELADYITYMTCSTEVPQEIRQCTLGWSVITLTSLRHKSQLPQDMPTRERLWDPENVLKVRKAMGVGEGAALAGPDPSLTGADLNLTELHRIVDAENCRSYAACVQNMTEAIQLWRQYLYRYDVIPGLLARSRHTRR